MVNGIEIFEYKGEGYKRLVDGPKWTAAILNYGPEIDEANFTQVERHMLTDETFVLLSGEATLIIGEDAQKVPMEPLKYYNIKAGVWHHVFATPGTSILIAENSDTAPSNTEYMPVKNK